MKGKGGFNFAVYVPDRQVWLGATGGETEAGSTIRQQPMEITQQEPRRFRASGKGVAWAKETATLRSLFCRLSQGS